MASASKVILKRLAYVVYEHPQLESVRAWAKDFGFVEDDNHSEDNVTYFRGYGKDRYVYVARQAADGASKKFVGGGFVAASEDDFERALHIEGAEEVDVSSRPGGGRLAVIHDPNGSEIQVLHGQEEQTPPEHGISVCSGGHPPTNGALDKQRKGEYTRMEKGPAMVHKLGHFGYETDQYEAACEWYTKHFNIVPTDVLWAPGNESLDVASFFRVDLSQEFVDHHCFLLTRNHEPGTKVHHASFEVEDIDTQFIGHNWLLQKGYELVWGIGRHVHGSQIFDYWYDPNKFIVEHYADGDLVNEDTKLLRAEAGNMAVWGPPVPVIWGGGAKEITA